jgi:hypothetical protein
LVHLHEHVGEACPRRRIARVARERLTERLRRRGVRRRIVRLRACLDVAIPYVDNARFAGNYTLLVKLEKF